ncbi:hypothetical protein IMY05_002G0152100 [Salix suchowensis]|nr:hypothetical protein IMY05_002G0152100 [Salix suchowensis]
MKDKMMGSDKDKAGLDVRWWVISSSKPWRKLISEKGHQDKRSKKTTVVQPFPMRIRLPLLVIYSNWFIGIVLQPRRRQIKSLSKRCKNSTSTVADGPTNVVRWEVTTWSEPSAVQVRALVT